jgi:hypothetical protein
LIWLKSKAISEENKMKTKLVNIVRNSLAIFGLMLTASLGCAFAQGENSGGGRLEGTWDAFVTLSNCETGTTIATFNSIATLMRDGTSIGSTAGIPQALRTPEHGVWRHVKADTYEFRFKSFSFDPNLNPGGWSIVKHQLELGAGANTYTSSGIGQIFAANGTQIRQLCSSAVGTRFEL